MITIPQTLVRFARIGFGQGATLLMVFALLTLTVACRNTAPAQAATPATPEATAGSAPAKAGAGLPAKARMADESPLTVNPETPADAGPRSGEIALPDRQPVTPPAAPASEYPSKLITGLKDPDSKITVKFNFDAAPMTDVVPLFASLLNFSYLIDPAVKGALSLTIPETEMTAREVWEMFEHILWLSGAYASRNPGFIHILPFAKMPQERRIFAKHEPSANVEVAVFQVYNTKSGDMMGILKPFATEGASITDLTRLNSLLIVESPANMDKLRELLTRLDDRGEARWPMKCIPCRTVDAEAVRDELQALLPILGLPVTDKATSGGEIKLIALPRLQVLIVSAALPEVVAEVEKWIHTLDQENTAEQENIFFYNVRHSTADRLTEALGVFFNTSGASSAKSTSTKSTSTKAAKPGDNAATPASPSAPAKSAQRSGQREAGARKTVFDNPVVIYTDSDQNRLTILTSPRTYAMVEALLKRLDISGRQVLIRAIIAEITLNKSTEFGFSYAAATHSQKLKVTGAATNTGTTATAAGADLMTLKNPSTGAAFLFQSANGADPLAFVRAVAGETNTKAISAPQIVAANDEQAVINVGDKVPIITQDYTSTASVSGSTNRTYQYTDTGTILTVTPHITAGNEVRLDVTQEASLADKDATLSDQIIIRNRKLETKLVVPDGGTVLMGGLIKTSNVESHTGIPWLKDIPLLGRLFRTNTTEQNRTEILVIMTVNVLSPESDISEVAAKFQAALQEIRTNLGPL